MVGVVSGCRNHVLQLPTRIPSTSFTQGRVHRLHLQPATGAAAKRRLGKSWSPGTARAMSGCVVGGIDLGGNPYDFYSLETAEDLVALRDLLRSHRDSTGRPPCLVMNFVLANVDFPRVVEGGFKEIQLKPLSHGLPGNWQNQRPGLFEAYQEGIAEGLFYPAIHGLTHFCSRAVERELLGKSERGNLLRELWKAGTPYIYWRMPWVGYEYYDPGKSEFLAASIQEELIGRAVGSFRELFGIRPISACAPGYRANRETQRAWADCGVRVAQNGSALPLCPHMDSFEVLNLYRTIDFEPAHRKLPIEEYLRAVDHSLARGRPAILSMHSLNFHSSLRDFSRPTLKMLDQLLTALERKYPGLLYLHDSDLYEIVTCGRLHGAQGSLEVRVRQHGRDACAVGAGAN